MSDTHASSDTRRELGQYEIRLKGHLEARWAAWFGGVILTHESDGTTVIRGRDRLVSHLPQPRPAARSLN